jgi:hypothetical protein
MMEAGRLPKPGEGPSDAVRRVAKFAVIVDVHAEDGSNIVVSMRGGECGYEEGRGAGNGVCMFLFCFFLCVREERRRKR